MRYINGGIGSFELIRSRMMCEAALAARIKAATHVLLAIDFDGTLAPIVDNPDKASLEPRTAQVLRALTLQDNVSVALVSGRKVSDLKRRIGLDLVYAGNHGLEISGMGLSFRHPRAEALRNSVSAICTRLGHQLRSIPGVLIENKVLTGTVHFRNAPPGSLRLLHETIRCAMLPYHRVLRLRLAKKAWEIYPRVRWNKGSAARLLLRRFLPRLPLAICIGDDETDEDMFKALPDAITIRVGPAKRSCAQYFVNGQAEVHAVLELILALASPLSEALERNTELGGVNALNQGIQNHRLGVSL